MKYMIRISCGGQFIGYMSHKNRMAWSKKVALKHALKYVALHGGFAELEEV